MTEVPDRDGADRLRFVGKEAHVVQAPRAVVDLRQHHRGDAIVERALDRLGFDNLELMPPREKSADALGDIEVGREISAVGKDDLARRRELEGRRQRLEEIDRGGVACDHGARRGANERADAVADPRRQVDPARGVPRADEFAAPAFVEFAPNALPRGFGHRAERVAVEIDDALRQIEKASCALKDVGHRRDLS